MRPPSLPTGKTNLPATRRFTAVLTPPSREPHPVIYLAPRLRRQALGRNEELVRIEADRAPQLNHVLERALMKPGEV